MFIIKNLIFPTVMAGIGEQPTEYRDTLSYYETLMWFCSYLKDKVTPAINDLVDNSNELVEGYTELKDYVDNYFESTDFTSLVSDKLDEMLADGDFDELLSELVDTKLAEFQAELTAALTEIRSEMTTLQTTLEGEMQTLQTTVEGELDTLETTVNTFADDIQAAKDGVEYINKTRNLQMPSEMKPIAHRGASEEAPENTLAAFELAGRQGFWGCETDIYESLDGVFFCIHDQTVDRTTDGTGYIWELSSSYIESLTIDAGSRVADYPNEHVPTLEEYLKVCNQYNMVPVIEMKDNITNFQELYDILYNHNMHRKVIIQSFLVANLEGMLAIDPMLKTARLENTINDTSVNHAIAHGIQSYNVKYDALSESEINRLHSLGLEVGGWMIDVAGVNHNMRNYFLDYSIIDSFDTFNTIQDLPKRYVNHIPLFSEKDLRYAAEGQYLGGILSGFIKRIRNADDSDIHTTYLPNTKVRVISTQIIPLRQGSTVWYVCDGQSKFSIQAFDRHGEALSDVGWIQNGIGAGTYTENREGCSFGVAIFGRSDDGKINEADLRRFSTIIQQVNIVPAS